MTLKPYKNAALADRYAKALLELADESKLLKKVQSDLSDIQGMIDGSGDFVTLLHSPVIKKNKQIDVVTAIAEKAKLQDLTRNFLGVLVSNGRLNVLPDVISAFFSLCDARDKKLTVSVKTAQKLTASQIKSLGDALGQALKTDVVVEPLVDESLLGGMVITAGSYMIDDSVAGKLARLKRNLSGGAVNENDDRLVKAG